MRALAVLARQLSLLGRASCIDALRAHPLLLAANDDGDASAGPHARTAGRIRAAVEQHDRIAAAVADLHELADTGFSEPDLADDAARLLSETDAALSATTAQWIPHASSPCLLTVSAGAGGADSEDWARMLADMYAAHASRIGGGVRWLEQSARAHSLEVLADGATAAYTGEAGVHRLVRVSPFNAAGKRHTSFAAVAVTPLLEEGEGIRIDPKDLDVQVFRSGGAGGQSVNTTDSAVRVVHRPSGITVVCQQERSQHRNRATAMRILHARLLERERAQAAKEKAARHDSAASNAFGSQLRSYVLHPYHAVKCHASGYSTPRATAVLDGGDELDRVIESLRVHRAHLAASAAIANGTWVS
ncbi:hypothetical protein H9P43_007093 [Blastocladiella emersonii ATCC 22665]|nr:hypothetical protein H9P43_007093 [Blastocladiella emersonii ATCC 22665]